MAGAMKAVLLMLFLLGCAKNDAQTNVQSIPPVLEQGNKTLEQEAPKKVEMKPRKKEALIMVGGCANDCGSPEKGIFGFVEACASNDVAKAQRFIDTTVLNAFGNDEGKRLRELAGLGMNASWREEVEKVTKTICAMFEGVSDTERKMVLASGIRKISARAEEARFEVLIEGKRFIFVVRPRGLEWLVGEIEKGGE
jgi:hypothetical protein